MGRLIRAISSNGGIILAVLDSTDIVATMHNIHGTSATAAAAFGRMLTAASLMGSMMKNKNDTLTLRINGNGQIGAILAVSDYLGNVRGCCDDPLADIPSKSGTNKLDVGGLVGKDGYLAVMRDTGEAQPYSGNVPIVSGEIAEDIAAYYAASEQIPTACALGVLVGTDLNVVAAGGYLLQLLPGASEEEISALEKNVSAASSITDMMTAGNNAEAIASIILSGFEWEILDDYTVTYLCPCSTERMEAALISLGKKDLAELIEQDGQAELICSFCNKNYLFDKQRLTQLFEASRG